jgi:site-specific DNA recombinase
MTALRTGKADIVGAESIDRFSRDLEHIASFHKHCIFNQVRIHTVSEGDISELHVGVKGLRFVPTSLTLMLRVWTI